MRKPKLYVRWALIVRETARCFGEVFAEVPYSKAAGTRAIKAVEYDRQE